MCVCVIEREIESQKGTEDPEARHTGVWMQVYKYIEGERERERDGWIYI